MSGWLLVGALVGIGWAFGYMHGIIASGREARGVLVELDEKRKPKLRVL